MAKRRTKTKTKKRRTKSKKRKLKGQIPLDVLEKRLGKLNALVNRRGGSAY